MEWRYPTIFACWLALASGCGGEERNAPGPGQPQATTPAPPASNLDAPEGWKYQPTLDEHAPEGLYLETVLELEEPAAGRVDLIVSVGRPAGPSLELWRFVAREPEGVLAPESDPAPLLRVGGDDPVAKELDAFRSRVAAPRNRVRRPPGLTETDDALLSELSALARTVRSTDANGEARAHALARLTRGLDDSLLFETNRTHEVLDVLTSGGAAELTERGARRSSGRLGEHEIGLVKKTRGWVITSLSRGPSTPSDTD